MTRPSSLPASAACPGFESSPTAGTFALDGTLRHEALAEKMLGREISRNLLEGLADDDLDAIDWAAGQIEMHAPMSQFALEVERKLTIFDPQGNEIMKGTADYVCGPVILDFKWRRRNYEAQLAAYALGLMQEAEFDNVECILLFGENREAQRFFLSRNKAESIVFALTVNRCPFSVASEYTPNDYCGWCAKHKACPAIIDAVNLAAKIADPNSAQLNQKADEQDEAVWLSQALIIARTVAKWAEAVESEMKAEAKNGRRYPGFTLESRRGNTYVKNIQKAFERAGLEPHEFLEVCKVSFTKLVKARAGKHGIALSKARQDAKNVLGDALAEESRIYYLKQKPIKK